MGTVLELKNCVKGLREFLYTHLNIKRFNMFTAWEKYRPDCTIILCTITGGTERSASKALEVLILPATRLNSSSKLKPTWLASHSHRHILCLCYSFKKMDLLWFLGQNECCAPVKEKHTQQLLCKSRHLVNEVRHQNLWVVCDETLSCRRKTLFKCFLWGNAQAGLAKTNPNSQNHYFSP